MDTSPAHSPLALAIEYSCSGSPNTNSNENDNSSAASQTSGTGGAGTSSTNKISNQLPKLDSSLVLGKCNEIPKRLCLVCGDIASGFHYGVASCEACKAFFKRTIQGNIEYSCPAQSDCEINKRRRKACQACRFQKCLRMGMLKEGVRLDRVRGGRQKYRRNGDSPYAVGSSSTQTGTGSTNNNYLNLLNNMRVTQPNPLITTLLNCEPEPIMAGSSLNARIDCKPFSSQSSSNMISVLSDLVDKELVSTIIWAKQIPGFTELILNDQMRLLQSTWAEILALSISYRTQQAFNTNASSSIGGSSSSGSKNAIVPTKLVFAADFIMEQGDAIECRAEEMFAYCLQLQRRITPLAITKQEFVLLKALLLVNVDIELEDSESVEKLRNNLLGALQEAVAQGKSPFIALQHLNELLLCLPLLRQLDFIIRKYWNQVRLDNKAPMNKLFVEMLECNINYLAFK